MTIAPGLSVLVGSFDAFLVDVWGVVHDGERPFAGVIPALERLAEAGRRVVFLTNTSRTGDDVTATLVRDIQIDRALFHDVVTAGDVTRRALLDAFLPRAPRCYHFGNAAFVPWLFELGLAFTDDLGAADLIIATGAVVDAAALDTVRAHLAPAAAREVPLVCTNPDRFIPTVHGLKLGPGAVARAYAELGGPTFLYGKPHGAIYAEARRHLGGVDDARVLAIGDTLETDVRGATNAGIAAALVTDTGVHAGEEMSSLFQREGLTPQFVLSRFSW